VKYRASCAQVAAACIFEHAENVSKRTPYNTFDNGLSARGQGWASTSIVALSSYHPVLSTGVGQSTQPLQARLLRQKRITPVPVGVAGSPGSRYRALDCLCGLAPQSVADCGCRMTVGVGTELTRPENPPLNLHHGGRRASAESSGPTILSYCLEHNSHYFGTNFRKVRAIGSFRVGRK
jgi:hypothetical protein